MKVSTNLTAGNVMDSAAQAATSLGSQVGSFINTAEQQAEGLTQPVANALSSLKQGFSDLLGLA
jgi:hypothetical protein